MAAFHIVLRCNAVVGDTLLFECVDRVGLLQERITDVLLVGEDLFDVAFMPPGVSGSVQNSEGYPFPGTCRSHQNHYRLML